MAIKIRLTRGGSKKRPFYRVVAADSRMPRDGRFIEKLGTYNPLLPKDNPERIKIDVDKIKDWINISDLIPKFYSNNKMKKTGLAGIFAASLELTKEGSTKISQEKIFGKVMIKKV